MIQRDDSFTDGPIPIGTTVRYDGLAEGGPEFGVVVSCWLDPAVGLHDCYVAFFGRELPSGAPTEKPYILRYASTSLARLEAERPTLSCPWIRTELVEHLTDLAAADPREAWRRDAERGLAAGIDAVVHFFFDDHDLDRRDLGVALYDEREVRLVRDLKAALNNIVNALPDGLDDEYVRHVDWPRVTRAARLALARIEAV